MTPTPDTTRRAEEEIRKQAEEEIGKWFAGLYEPEVGDEMWKMFSQGDVEQKLVELNTALLAMTRERDEVRQELEVVKGEYERLKADFLGDKEAIRDMGDDQQIISRQLQAIRDYETFIVVLKATHAETVKKLGEAEREIDGLKSGME